MRAKFGFSGVTLLIFIYHAAALASAGTPDVTNFYRFGVPFMTDKEVYAYGTFQVPIGANYHGYYQKGRKLRRSCFPGASNTFLAGITIYARSWGITKKSNAPYRGFIYIRGNCTDLIILSCSNTVPTGLDSLNHMVGECQSSTGHGRAFLIMLAT